MAGRARYEWQLRSCPIYHVFGPVPCGINVIVHSFDARDDEPGKVATARLTMDSHPEQEWLDERHLCFSSPFFPLVPPSGLSTLTKLIPESSTVNLGSLAWDWRRLNGVVWLGRDVWVRS